jgi:hypothetical protein
MKRDQLLVPGEFASIPLAVLADKRLSPIAKLAYCALLNHLGENDHVWPSLRTLAAETGCSLSGVVAAINRLVELNYCEIQQQLDGWRTSNRYVLSLPEESTPEPERVLPVEHSRVLSVEHERVLSFEHSCTAERTSVYCPSNIHVLRSEQGCSKDSTEPLKETTKEEPPHSNHSKGTTSLSPASRVPPAWRQDEREEPPLESPAKPEEQRASQEPASKEQAASQGSPAIQNGKKMTRVESEYIQLAGLWKQADIGALGTAEDLRRHLEQYKLQAKLTGRRLEPEKVIRTLRERSLEIPFSDLWNKNGREFVWSKLSRGAKPCRPARRDTFKDSEIEAIYDAYPRHVKRPEALQEIKNALHLLKDNRPELPMEEHVAWMLDRVERYARSKDGNNGQYTPYPSNWFRQGRYLDDPEEWDVRENRSGNIKRVIDPAKQEEPGMTTEELLDLNLEEC